jgi:hypothetical protein
MNGQLQTPGSNPESNPSEQQKTADPPPTPAADPKERPASNLSAPANNSGVSNVESQTAPSGLTKEEQWALFEKELKENDWGHQPC